jgi:hypothetical protein
VQVTFDPSTPYERALRLVTDAGFQPAFECTDGSQWQPMGQRDLFLQNHRLVVYPTAYDPTDWEGHLRASADVTDVASGAYAGFPGTEPRTTETPGVAYFCGNTVGPALTGTPAVLGRQAGVFARVTFASPLDSYDAALSVVVDLGLALADYCYDHASHPAGHPMGQEQAFAVSKTLVVVTMPRMTSDHWQEQLTATSGVVSVKAPYAPACPS